jgi:hypothetical protein
MSRNCRYNPSYLATALIGLAATLVSLSAEAAKKGETKAAHKAGEIVVRFKNATKSYQPYGKVLLDLEQGLGNKAAVAKFKTLKTDEKLGTIRISSDSELGRAMDILRANPEVDVAEPNFLYHTMDISRTSSKKCQTILVFRNSGE